MPAFVRRLSAARVLIVPHVLGMENSANYREIHKLGGVNQMYRAIKNAYQKHVGQKIELKMALAPAQAAVGGGGLMLARMVLDLLASGGGGLKNISGLPPGASPTPPIPLVAEISSDPPPFFFWAASRAVIG